MIKRATDLRQETRVNMVGGKGEAQLTYLLELDEFSQKGRLYAKISLAPGENSVGYHQHKGDFEVYYVLKGKGLLNDNGALAEVTDGDVVYTKNGESHSIENIGEENLDLMALILFD